MTTHGERQHAAEGACNSTVDLPRSTSPERGTVPVAKLNSAADVAQGPGTAGSNTATGTTKLIGDTDGVRTWRITTTIVCRALRHDTIAAYKNHGCRCPKATKLAVGYERRRQCGHVAPNQPATMTRLRLQALASIGWTGEAIAERIRRNPVTVTEIRRGEVEVVTGRTAQAVHRVYRQLCDKPGPSARSRSFARRQGWDGPSPLLHYFDIDEVAVQRAVDGLTTAAAIGRGERLAAVMQMQRAGLTYAQMAARLNTSERQVHRDLSDLGMSGTYARKYAEEVAS